MTLEEAFDKFIEFKQRQGLSGISTVSYTHLTLPTN